MEKKVEKEKKVKEKKKGKVVDWESRCIYNYKCIKLKVPSMLQKDSPQ